MRYWLVMPAAGSGSRFGAATPKQYARLAGRSVIEWSMAVFLEDSRCHGVVVAVAAGDERFAALPASGDPRVCAVEGGAERSDSVRLSLAALDVHDDEWVLVHDAARPCLSRDDLDALVREVGNDDVGGLLAVPLADTLKRADSAQRVVQTPDRSGLWRALTPQMFRVGTLRRALSEAHAQGRVPTDEAQAIEWLGLAPRLVAGSAQNLKVTGPDDLRLAAALLAGTGAGV
jgi:2-C-methyl-D-erythritol 4-phosphate cytidylyltransferase